MKLLCKWHLIMLEATCVEHRANKSVCYSWACLLYVLLHGENVTNMDVSQVHFVELSVWAVYLIHEKEMIQTRPVGLFTYICSRLWHHLKIMGFRLFCTFILADSTNGSLEIKQLPFWCLLPLLCVNRTRNTHTLSLSHTHTNTHIRNTRNKQVLHMDKLNYAELKLFINYLHIHPQELLLLLQPLLKLLVP